MPKQIVTSASAPTSGATPGQAESPLAQAVRFGNMLFVSGVGAVDPATGDVVDGDITAQTRLALDNLMSVLAAAGATTKNIVNVRVTLRDVADFPRFNETVRYSPTSSSTTPASASGRAASPIAAATSRPATPPTGARSARRCCATAR